ncbi:MAG: DUF3592 domain-containing protein [Deltaproteobacteria bacterium]|nr:DUF3592 domain-containing protein [Deltaproteobacteria bacterium]
MLWFLVLSPVIQVAKSDSWIDTPCTIVENRLDETVDDDNTRLYQPVVRYQYRLNGVSFDSDRIDFGPVSATNIRNEASTVLSQYSRGTTTHCFVNPENPAQAVLKRQAGHHVLRWLVASLGIIFVIVGLSIIVRNNPFRSSQNDSKNREYGKIVLTPFAQRRKQTIVGIFATLFWNGIVSVFVVFWLRGLLDGTASGAFETWGLGLFLLPFAVIGVGMVVSLLKTFLKNFAPAVSLSLESCDWVMGSTVRLQWTVPAHAQLNRFELDFICEESVTYRRGTDTTTDTEVVAVFPIARETGRVQSSGSVQFHVPTNVMPNFESPNNRINWKIRVVTTGDGPDANDAYDVTLHEGSAHVR